MNGIVFKFKTSPNVMQIEVRNVFFVECGMKNVCNETFLLTFSANLVNRSLC